MISRFIVSKYRLHQRYGKLGVNDIFKVNSELKLSEDR